MAIQDTKNFSMSSIDIKLVSTSKSQPTASLVKMPIYQGGEMKILARAEEGEGVATQLPNGTKAINVGCGTTVASGWINIDNSPNARLAKYPLLRELFYRTGLLSENHYCVPWPKDIVVRDVRKGLPFPANYADYVYSSHALEHLSCSDGENLVKEVFRVLKPGGLCRLVVPDLLWGCRKYVAARSLSLEDDQPAVELLDWLGLSKPGARAPHLWMYDYGSLKVLLERTGFVQVTEHSYHAGEMPDIDILDVRPDDSLHVEARKPTKL